jgi:hypothetical protein
MDEWKYGRMKVKEITPTDTLLLPDFHSFILPNW